MKRLSANRPLATGQIWNDEAELFLHRQIASVT